MAAVVDTTSHAINIEHHHFENKQIEIDYYDRDFDFWCPMESGSIQT